MTLLDGDPQRLRILNYEGGTFRQGRPHEPLGDGGTTHLTLLTMPVDPPPRSWADVPSGAVDDVPAPPTP